VLFATDPTVVAIRGLEEFEPAIHGVSGDAVTQGFPVGGGRWD
jgi:hypothetical protein